MEFNDVSRSCRGRQSQAHTGETLLFTTITKEITGTKTPKVKVRSRMVGVAFRSHYNTSVSLVQQLIAVQGTRKKVERASLQYNTSKTTVHDYRNEEITDLRAS